VQPGSRARKARRSLAGRVPDGYASVVDIALCADQPERLGPVSPRRSALTGHGRGLAVVDQVLVAVRDECRTAAAHIERVRCNPARDWGAYPIGGEGAPRKAAVVAPDVDAIATMGEWPAGRPSTRSTAAAVRRRAEPAITSRANGKDARGVVAWASAMAETRAADENRHTGARGGEPPWRWEGQTGWRRLQRHEAFGEANARETDETRSHSAETFDVR